MRHSDRWNPLAENQNITDVQTSSDVIISNTQKHDKGGDEFWPRAEENLLKAFLFYFLENLSDRNNLTKYINIYQMEILVKLIQCSKKCLMKVQLVCHIIFLQVVLIL